MKPVWSLAAYAESWLSAGAVGTRSNSVGDDGGIHNNCKFNNGSSGRILVVAVDIIELVMYIL